MSALDHAQVQIHTTSESARERRRARPRVTPAKFVVGFAAAQVPLALVALLTEWRDAWAAPEDRDHLVSDVVFGGSAISGPLSAQLILLTLAFFTTRSHRVVRTLGTAGIGIMGLAVMYNGAASALTDPAFAPHAVTVIAGIGFFACGATMTALAVRDLRAARR